MPRAEVRARATRIGSPRAACRSARARTCVATAPGASRLRPRRLRRRYAARAASALRTRGARAEITPKPQKGPRWVVLAVLWRAATTVGFAPAVEYDGRMRLLAWGVLLVAGCDRLFGLDELPPVSDMTCFGKSGEGGSGLFALCPRN